MEPLVQETLPDIVADDLIRRHLGDVLSERELEVAQLAVSGLTTAEIARKLYVTLNTVKTHIRHILRKTGAVNRSELAHRILMAEANRPPSGAGQATTGGDRPTGEANLLYGDKYAHLRDPLTGLLSQEAFGQIIAAVQMSEDGQELSILFLEMDGRENLAPLEMIKLDLAITSILSSTLRSSDLVFRWSEDQFVGLLPNVDRNGAREVCMRLAICLSQWAQELGYDLLFSLSASSSHEGISSPDGLVEAAQKRLDLGLGRSA